MLWFSSFSIVKNTQAKSLSLIGFKDLLLVIMPDPNIPALFFICVWPLVVPGLVRSSGSSEVHPTKPNWLKFAWHTASWDVKWYESKSFTLELNPTRTRCPSRGWWFRCSGRSAWWLMTHIYYCYTQPDPGSLVSYARGSKETIVRIRQSRK